VKLKYLDLKAFGPFTEQKLEFTTSEPGLHIIFGRNEAGKSSSLRALKALLYGFPQQTPDNFLHSYDQLLVGGCLENSNGDKIFFQRRKKRIGDIMDADGNTLDSSTLAPFLHNVEPAIFENLYGIDHEALIRGGEEILAQKGEVGKALFAAGAGISSVREVIEQLEKEAAELFKPKGQLPEINRAVKRFNELKKEAKEATLSSKVWKDHQTALNNAEAERSELELERQQKNIELHRLERLARALPELATLKSWHDQLSSLGEVISLPSDFTRRHAQINQEMRDAARQLQRDKAHLIKIQAKRKSISLNKTVLAHAERVDDYHQRLGEYRKGQQDKPKINGMRINFRKEAAYLLQQIRADLDLNQVETLRPFLTRKKTVHSLSTQYELINQQLIQDRKTSRAAKTELKAIAKELEQTPEERPHEHLLQAIRVAQKAGDIDTQLARYRSDIELSRKECLAELKRIGLWSGNLTKLIELSLPLAATVHEFQKSYNKIADERRSLEKEIKRNKKELETVLAEIRKTEYTGEIPSEKYLNLTRKKRDRGWLLLRRQLLDGGDISREARNYDPEQSLLEAYEGFVREADHIADRLRREADRVASITTLRIETEQSRESLKETGQAENILERQAQKLADDWSYVWQRSEITPLSPAEMIGWLSEIDKLRFKASDNFKKVQILEQAEKQRLGLKQSLHRELEIVGEKIAHADEKLDPVLSCAETVLEAMTDQKNNLLKLQERKRRAKKSFQQAKEELAAAHDALIKWQDMWQQVLSGLDLKDEVSTFEAIDLIDTLKNCFDKLKEADDIKKRIVGIDRDAAELEREVGDLVEKAAPDIIGLPLDQAILQLRTMLRHTQKDSILYNKLSEEIDTLEKEISSAGKIQQDANMQMDELLRLAKCGKPEDLAAVSEKFTEYQRLQEKISDTEATLASIGAGAEIAELTRQVAEINGDELPGQIDSLHRDIDERINREINKISQIIGEENTKLAAMDGSGRAAEVAEKMEQELARIRRLSERYAMAKIGCKILQQEIERYREENQDPVLRIASRHFNDLTLGSFTSLRTDVDNSGEPVLVGVRPNDLRLTVAKMSSGTRDQLYLALRLATLEWRFNSSEPMPFIIDDILINFDDDRSKATLLALSGLSKKNQVILFTHHRQIIEEANSIETDREIQIHEL